MSDEQDKRSNSFFGIVGGAQASTESSANERDAAEAEAYRAAAQASINTIRTRDHKTLENAGAETDLSIAESALKQVSPTSGQMKDANFVAKTGEQKVNAQEGKEITQSLGALVGGTALAMSASIAAVAHKFDSETIRNSGLAIGGFGSWAVGNCNEGQCLGNRAALNTGAGPDQGKDTGVYL